MSLRFAVFASGGGSNLQALLDRMNGTGATWGEVALVVSDRAAAGALERARAMDVPTAVIHVSGRDASDVETDALDALAAHDIGAVALAGYLRLVPPGLTTRYRGRIVNIHPALLPAFGGKGMYGRRVHEAVLARGCTVTGVTVHHVDERYDEGRPIAQWPVPVLPDDTPDSLAARVLQVEHLLYPLALERLARGLEGRSAAIGEGFTLGDEGPIPAMRAVLGLDSEVP